jgi:hypothetical protein
MQRNQYRDDIQTRDGKEKTDKTQEHVGGNRKIDKRWCVAGNWFMTFQKTVVPPSCASSPRRLPALKMRAPQYFEKLGATHIRAALHSRRPEPPEQRRSAMMTTSLNDNNDY